MNKKKFAFLPKSIIVAIVLTTFIVNVIKSCPLVCTCKWKGGKRKVECANKNLTSLLDNIDSETQVLDYSKNTLQTLRHKVFEEANLINLQKLYLSECQISQIHDTAFHGLSNLIELDVSNNMLSTVPSQTFKDFPLLMKLILSGNPIHLIKSRTFSPLKYLATLDLSDCLIETIEKDIFDGLTKLEWLKLDGNKLKNFKFAESIPEVTSGLSLHRNPWKCDCHLRSFHSWLVNLSKTIPLIANPVCDEPIMHRASPISQLSVNDLACAPCIIPSSLFIEINEGKNISFVCQVNAIPEANITWEFEGKLVSNNSSFIYPFYKYYAEEATTEQVSELFVFDAKKENNGTYRCTAENVAGKSISNYTLRVISVQKQTPPTTDSLNFHVIISSVGTLLIVTSIAFLFIICLVYCNKKRSASSPAENKKQTNVKPEIRYEIMKVNVAETSSPCKTDNRNPDLIINTANNKLENSEHLLILPAEVKQTYLTMPDGTLLNGAVLPSAAAENPQIANNSTLIASAEAAPTNTIKFYLSSSNANQNFHNLYVNPFDGYDNSLGQNYWTIHLLNDGSCSEKSHVVVDYCNHVSNEDMEAVCSVAAVSNREEIVNLRHNLEGYPYPSKLKLTPIEFNHEEEVSNATPILSPPDPFKTSLSNINSTGTK